MKICILANARSVHTQKWARAFAEKANQVHIISIRRVELPKIKVHTVCVGPENSSSIFWTFLSYMRLLFCARRLIKKISPDIINAYYVLTHGVIAAFADCHPLVISIWGSDIVWDQTVRIPSCMKVFLKYSFARADAVCATSRFLIDYVAPLVKNTKNFSHIPFGIDCRRFSPAASAGSQKPPNYFRIGYVKTLDKIYGPQVLINAMPQIIKALPGAKLILTGIDKTNGGLKRLAEELGIGGNVEFTGFFPNERIPELLRSFDVYVHPSICQESFGVSILEASACGLPVVATRVGGVPEVCIDGKTGILVELNSSNSLAEAVIKLAKDPDLCNAMGKAGREFVIKNYDWNKNVASMLEVLQKTFAEYKSKV